MESTYSFLQLVEIEYMQNKHFQGDSYQSLQEMKPVIENDYSNVDIHLAFINNCNGGMAILSRICKVHPLAVNCLGPSTTPLLMAEIVTHEMGHVLGKITSSLMLFKTFKNMGYVLNFYLPKILF